MSRPPVCHYYQAGNCRNGDCCPFTHPTVRCRTFTSSGWCPYGYSCHFWHDPSAKKSSPPAVQRKICQFFANNQCKYGDKCSFSHDLEAEHSSGLTLEEYRAQKKFSSLILTSQPNLSTKRSSNSFSMTPANGLGASASNLFSPDKPAARERPTITSRAPVPRPDKATTQVRLEGITQSEIDRLQQTEVSRLIKGVSADRLREVDSADDGKTFHLRFSSTDPDWVYDVREVLLSIHLDPRYPVEPLQVCVLPKEHLPTVLVEHLNNSIASWISSRHNQTRLANRAELYLQQFFHWLDRSLEHLFTVGLRKYKAQLLSGAKEESRADWDLDVPSSQNTPTTSVSTPPSSETQPQHEPNRPELSYESFESDSNDGLSDSTYSFDEDLELAESRSASDTEHHPANALRTEEQTVPLDASGSAIKATQRVYLEELKLNGKAGTLIQRQLPAALHCVRCKLPFSWIFNLHGDPFTNDGQSATRLRSLPPHSVNCARCHHLMKLVFQAIMAHAFETCVGTLHLDGCIADDIPSKAAELVVLCTECNKVVKLTGVQPGRQVNRRCFTCHSIIGVDFSKFRLEAVKGTLPQVAFTKQPDGDRTEDSLIASRKQRRLVNAAQNPLIQDGSPLPAYGTCKHYRKSYRWLRFPCCGRLDPCDVCHDEAVTDGHEMELATRMVCGFCSKEQAFSSTKPCVRCGKQLAGSRSAHWEGGKGCRNKVTMSRKDVKKYAQLNKTVSRNKTKPS